MTHKARATREQRAGSAILIDIHKAWPAGPRFRSSEDFPTWEEFVQTCEGLTRHYLIRQAFLSEREEFEKCARSFEIWKDNVVAATWRRWRNWGENRPYLAWTRSSKEDLSGSGQLIGFNAASFGKPGGYLNIYYIGVIPDWRGWSVAEHLMSVVLQEARSRCLPRIKWKCLKDNKPGLNFWYSVGAYPCAETERELVFDHRLSVQDYCATDCEQLKELWSIPGDELPMRSLLQYAKAGAVLPHAKRRLEL